MIAPPQAERPLRGTGDDALQIDDRPLRGALEVKGLKPGCSGSNADDWNMVASQKSVRRE